MSHAEVREKNMDTLQKFLQFDLGKKIAVAVVGDTMIDEYHHVHVNRISPEFPIPVMLSENSEPDEAVPGGAANVAYQFHHFNAEAMLVGVLDERAERAYRGRMNLDYAVQVRQSLVPRKKRFYHDGFPLCRFDIERPHYGQSLQKTVFSIPKADVTIFSDYDKGLFDTGWHKPYLPTCLSIVDPKNNLSRWRGCSILKPNSVEAEKLSGKKDWVEQCRWLQSDVNCGAVVITQGGDGVVGLDGNSFFEYRSSAFNPAPRSVIGAGDCFMAFLAMAVARGMSIRDAAVVAFEAGAVYVRSNHNKPITRLELGRHSGVCGKIVRPDDMVWPRKGKLVFANGCFDAGLTSGHVSCLQFARNQGDCLVVAVNSDNSVRRLKGPGRPIVPLDQRMFVLSGLECVDYVVSFDDDTPQGIIHKIRPDIVVKGGDYRTADVIGSDICEVRLSPLVECLSTTEKLAAFHDIIK